MGQLARVVHEEFGSLCPLKPSTICLNGGAANYGEDALLVAVCCAFVSFAAAPRMSVTAKPTHGL